MSLPRRIFSSICLPKNENIAHVLYLHLRWWPDDSVEDNFVSWTSSLLFAIQYIYYRHLHTGLDGSSLADIKLYVVDTTKFPKGTFMCDMDLMKIFSEFDGELNDFQRLRQGGKYYFGEYLSQGSLKIENKCHVIPAQVLFEQDRLRRLQPQFAELRRYPKSGKPGWANKVLDYRSAIWPLAETLPVLSSAEMSKRLQAVREIIDHVAPGWKYPLAIYFAALVGCESEVEVQGTGIDTELLAFFRSPSLRCKSRGFIDQYR